MKKLFTILAGTFLCFGATLLIPFAGEGSGMSPIPSAWAAPGCVDADNDEFYKYHPKWCPDGNDPDDSDPCVTPDATSCGRIVKIKHMLPDSSKYCWLCQAS